MEDEQPVHSKQMTKDELQKSVDRLSRREPKEATATKPEPEKTYITKEQLDKRIKHLYDESLARRAMEREEIAKQVDAAAKKDATVTTTTMSAEDEQAMVRRLYDESIQRKEQNLQEMYNRETASSKEPKKKLKGDEQQEVTDRLYKEGMQRERDKHIELYKKFVEDRRPPATQRTKEELAASSAKMSRGEGVTPES